MMNQSIKYFLILLTFWSCRSSNLHNNKAFYYWKTALDIPKKDVTLADKLNVDHFYIRYFDIQYSYGYNKPIPLGILNAESYQGNSFVRTKSFTPVIFIDNNTFIKSDEFQLLELASNIHKKVDEINQDILRNIDLEMPNVEWEIVPKKQDSIKAVLLSKINEVQIDCDWTKTTKAKYFDFLKLLQSKYGNTVKVTCTLRLHQYKYREETGIPPVSKVMLMCYNMDDIKSFDTKNSIFSEAMAKKYLIDKKYPLEIDVALPIFSWGIAFRNNNFIGILNNLNESSVKADTNLIHLKDNLYQFKIDAEIGNTYIRSGDVLRLEQPNKAELQKIIDLLKKRVVNSNSRITFYHWDKDLINNYYEDIQNYYNSFN